MIINPNTLSNPKDVIKSAKNIMKNFTPRRQLPKVLLLISNRLNIYNGPFNFQMMALQQNFIYTFKLN